mmetsp:Transcript_133699/g.387073  ORF Transcript_133699/g.387073 Transcript_133699/m.387073 type:complete len:299 (+) Transcript_133699:100-996(+)
MAYMATPSAILTLNGRSVEVPAFVCLADLQERAEAEFGLQPNSYDLFDACGKVETTALQRVVRMAGDEACQLELRERPEWKKLRELEARIEAVASQQMAAQSVPQPEVALLDLAILDGVGRALQGTIAGLAALETKVNQNLAPLVQSMALSQIDTKAKLETIDGFALKCRLDSLEELLSSMRMSAMPQDMPACKLDLSSEGEVWQKHRQQGFCRGGLKESAIEGRRNVCSSGAEGMGKLTRAFGEAREALDILHGVSTSPKAWHRALKPLGHDRGAGHRTLERKYLGSRSSPLLPPVS